MTSTSAQANWLLVCVDLTRMRILRPPGASSGPSGGAMFKGLQGIIVFSLAATAATGSVVLLLVQELSPSIDAPIVKASICCNASRRLVALVNLFIKKKLSEVVIVLYMYLTKLTFRQ